MSEAPVAKRPTILVVDDEEDLRDIMRRMLERRGSYTTLATGEPDEALSIARDHRGRIDVLITDLTLPGASGGELARTIRKLRSRIGVVFVSGLPKEHAVAKGEIAGDDILVKKPFTADELLSAVKEAQDDDKNQDDESQDDDES